MPSIQYHSADLSNPVPLYVAVHQAAHAVAAEHAFGKKSSDPFRRVVVRGKREIANGPYEDDSGREHIAGFLDGSTHFAALLYRYRGFTAEAMPAVDARLNHIIRTTSDKAAIVALAGPIAEAKYRRSPNAAAFRGSGADDYDYAQACVSHWYTDRRAQQREMEKLIARSAGLVRTSWASILAVATRLQTRRELSYEEVVGIMTGA